MGVSLFVSDTLDTTMMNRSADQFEFGNTDRPKGPGNVRNSSLAPHSPYFVVIRRLSPWSQSGAKRLFDCACFLTLLLLIVPVLLVIALAVRLTSPSPVFFLQKRMGRSDRTFTILKFRSMVHVPKKAHNVVTTAASQAFTPIGAFVRRWKVDELPQLLNVLAGDMSLVGPGPKMQEHVVSKLPCHPWITGSRVRPPSLSRAKRRFSIRCPRKIRSPSITSWFFRASAGSTPDTWPAPRFFPISNSLSRARCAAGTVRFWKIC